MYSCQAALVRGWSIGDVGRNGTSLCQHFRIGLDVRSERYFDDVLNAIGSQRPNSFRQVSSCQQNFVYSCSRCDLLVGFEAACGDHPRPWLMRQLNRASSNRPGTVRLRPSGARTTKSACPSSGRECLLLRLFHSSCDAENLFADGFTQILGKAIRLFERLPGLGRAFGGFDRDLP